MVRNNNSVKNKVLMGLFIIGLTLLLALRDIGSIGINRFVYLGFIIGCAFFANGESVFCMIAFISPLLWGLPGGFILPVMIGVHFYKNREKVSKQFLVFTLFFVLLEIFDSLFYIDFDVISYVKYISHLAVLYMLLYEQGRANDRILSYFMLGITVLCSLVIISNIKSAPSNWLELFAKGWYRFGGDLRKDEEAGMGLIVNANTLAYYSIVGLACGAFTLFCSSRKEKTNLGILVQMAVYFIAGVLTLSRTWMLCCVILIILILKVAMRSIRSFFYGIFALLMACCGVVFFISNNPDIMTGITTRLFEASSYASVSTAGGRTVLFAAYWEAFISNVRTIITGTGVVGYKEITGIYNSMHNALQQIIVCMGIPGGIVFIVSLAIPVLKHRKKKLVYWMPWIIVVLFVQSIQFLNPEALMLPYGMSCLVFGMENKNKQK